MHVHDHLAIEAFQSLTDSIRDTKLWKRHQAVELAVQGRSAKEIAQTLSCSQRAGNVGKQLVHSADGVRV